MQGHVLSTFQVYPHRQALSKTPANLKLGLHTFAKYAFTETLVKGNSSLIIQIVSYLRGPQIYSRQSLYESL